MKFLLKIGVLMLSLSATAMASEESKEKEEGAQSTAFLVHESARSFEETLSKLTKAIADRGLKTFAVIDHAKGAASIDQELRPTTLVIFGNPKGGTPFMQSAQTMGLALPLKALVYQDEDGKVKVATPDIKKVAASHGVADLEPLQEKIAGLLVGLAKEAGQ